MTQQALRAVAVTTRRLHAAEDAQREAILAANEQGASLRKIATGAGLSHEQVRRIVQGDSVAPYFVTVERRGVSPLQVQLLPLRDVADRRCLVSGLPLRAPRRNVSADLQRTPGSDEDRKPRPISIRVPHSHEGEAPTLTVPDFGRCRSGVR